MEVGRTSTHPGRPSQHELLSGLGVIHLASRSVGVKQWLEDFSQISVALFKGRGPA